MRARTTGCCSPAARPPRALRATPARSSHLNGPTAWAQPAAGRVGEAGRGRRRGMAGAARQGRGVSSRLGRLAGPPCSVRPGCPGPPGAPGRRVDVDSDSDAARVGLAARRTRPQDSSRQPGRPARVIALLLSRTSPCAADRAVKTSPTYSTQPPPLLPTHSTSCCFVRPAFLLEPCTMNHASRFYLCVFSRFVGICDEKLLRN